MSLLCEIKVPSLANEMVVGVCRCCLSHGYNKDMLQAFSWVGEDEIYYEMLIDCFSITISEQNSATDGRCLICDICITRLRDAAKFKEQVIAAQINFQREISEGSKNRFGIDEIVKIEEGIGEELHIEDNDETFIIEQRPRTRTKDKNTAVEDEEIIFSAKKKPGSNLSLCWARDPLIICRTCGNTYPSIEIYSKHARTVFSTKINVEKFLCKDPNRIVESFTDVCDWDLLNDCKHVSTFDGNGNLRDRTSIARKRTFSKLGRDEFVEGRSGNLRRLRKSNLLRKENM